MQILVTRRIKVLSVFKPTKIRTHWLSKDFKCKCGCCFVLEKIDEPKVFARLEEVDAGVVGVNDMVEYFVYCPGGCGRTVDLGDSFPRQCDYNTASIPNSADI
ncbi:MAG: hypothetical protein A3B86_03355 [Candidatus Yanofskybacteria bacterium RIFCSPHIGHO2_02_FULL_38_22b]|uniref:Uncharacterized protein n=1 Tax=Candidatus Yanofskybacteria bacterium RIFCSPHIGHO2_02_FULL_38_22b TaxID=1802673 RepID=A0A1F8F2W4_9BACT|nr:MAG: hypothetical protein A3B86_03355 [Candidatus Yanofskybacteria bacterium RIFCSPHIGHO2_02_FULL_38_22b]OGN19885.1 MAG: hypothetical protein A2910_01930 [Candidatus Yanofskybacteria bacterium RIFCSPLOWO2_01_FULL_39_28]